MNKLKNELLAAIIICFVIACTSEEETLKLKPEVNGDWSTAALSLGVIEGSVEDNVTSRVIGELTEGGLTKAEYPKTLGLYLLKYTGSEKGEFDENIIALYEEKENEGTDRIVEFVYLIDKTNNVIHLKKNATDADDTSLTLQIRESEKDVWSGDFFCFTSQKDTEGVKFPKLENHPCPEVAEYADAVAEYGDRLFVSNGYYFAWKDKKKGVVGLYYYIENNYEGTEEKDGDVVEAEEWQKKGFQVPMSRKTACLSVRLLIVDSFKDGNFENISDIEMNMNGQDAIDLTNKALNDYIDKIGKPDSYKFGIENMFIDKKVLTDYPTTYTWAGGLDTRDDRNPIFICNLDHPAWMDEVTYFENGSTKSVGLTSVCDNEPFIIVDSKSLSGLSFDLFLGIGDVETGTYGKEVVLKTNFYNALQLTPNTVTRMYIYFTLKNLVDFYEHFTKSTPGTRSVTEFTISPEQVVVVSEPLNSKHI